MSDLLKTIDLHKQLHGEKAVYGADTIENANLQIEKLKKLLDETIQKRDEIISNITYIQPEWFNEFALYFIFNNFAVDKITFKFDTSNNTICSYVDRFFNNNDRLGGRYAYKVFELTKNSTIEEFNIWLDNEFGERPHRVRTPVSREDAIEILIKLRSEYVKNTL